LDQSRRTLASQFDIKPSASLDARSIAFGTLISAVSEGILKPTADRQTHWNFGNPRGNPVDAGQ
jgi:hypothetical protein